MRKYSKSTNIKCYKLYYITNYDCINKWCGKNNTFKRIFVLYCNKILTKFSNSYCLVWGYFASNESIPKNSGKTFSFNYSTSFSSFPYNILMNCYDDSGTDNGASSYTTAVISTSVSTCKARIGNWASAARSLYQCYYLVIGRKN